MKKFAKFFPVFEGILRSFILFFLCDWAVSIYEPSSLLFDTVFVIGIIGYALVLFFINKQQKDNRSLIKSFLFGSLFFFVASVFAFYSKIDTPWNFMPVRELGNGNGIALLSIFGLYFALTFVIRFLLFMFFFSQNKKSRVPFFVSLGIVLALLCYMAIDSYVWNVKYYDREEVLELFQSANPEIRMNDHITELHSRMPYSQLNASDIIELRDTSSSDIEWQESYIWVLFYSSEDSVSEDLNNPYLSRSCVVAYDKNIIIYGSEESAGALLDVCKTLFPETYQDVN